MESRIKERLTGALILVAALVILVPEIFSGRRGAERATQEPPAAPATEGPPLRSYTAELGAATPPLSTPQVEAPAVEAQGDPIVVEPERATSPAPQTQSAPATRPAAPLPTTPPAVSVPAPAAQGDWYVQVGSFSQAANAQRYASQLREQGYTVAVLPPSGSKSLSRVRVGPARTREAATQLLDKLSAAGHKGAVVGP